MGERQIKPLLRYRNWLKRFKDLVKEELGKKYKNLEEKETDHNNQREDMSELGPRKVTTKTVQFNNTITEFKYWGKSEEDEAHNKSRRKSSRAPENIQKMYKDIQVFTDQFSGILIDIKPKLNLMKMVDRQTRTVKVINPYKGGYQRNNDVDITNKEKFKELYKIFILS